MSVQALLDHPSRLRARSAAARRPPRKDAAPTRASLIVDFLAICELDPAVEALRAPADPAAAFAIAGAAIQHMADFEIVRDGVATLVDVLTDDDLAHHPLRAALLGGATAADGRAFTVETPASLRAEPRFTTVRLIRACRRTLVSAGDRVRILHHLDECGTTRLVEARARRRPRRTASPPCWRSPARASSPSTSAARSCPKRRSGGESSRSRTRSSFDERTLEAGAQTVDIAEVGSS